MLKSLSKPLPLTTLAVVCGVMMAPSGVGAAPMAGGVFAPSALPAGVLTPSLTENVQARRRARARRRAVRRARRAVRRARRNVRRGRRIARTYRPRRRVIRRSRPRLRVAIPTIAVPGYYYADPYYDYPAASYDPYYYGGHDYTPAPSYGGRCERWRRRCEINWGYGNQDFWGCMRYHGCH